MRPLAGAAALAVFGSPSRLELVDRLQAGGPASLRELARRVERPLHAVYFHLRKLLRAGAVVEHARRATGRRPETIFAAVGGLRVDHDDRSRATGAALQRGAQAVLRMADRQLRAAFGAKAVRAGGADRNVLFLRAKARLSRAERDEVRRRIDALLAYVRGCAARRRGEPCVLTLVLTPLLDPPQRSSSR